MKTNGYQKGFIGSADSPLTIKIVEDRDMNDENICPCGDAAETDDGQCRACAAIDQRIRDGSDSETAEPCDMCGVVGFCDCTAEDYIDACPECDSTGTVDGAACMVCLGHGIQRFKWVVEFPVTPNWVEDGFDLDDGRALLMLAMDLPYAYPNELGAKVTRRPAAATIKRFQGYA